MLNTESDVPPAVTRVWSCWPLLVGIGGMLLLVRGTFLPPGSLIQQLLFLIGGFTMGVTAYVNDEQMLTTLQTVITLGALLTLLDWFSVRSKLVILGGAATVGIGWLMHIDYLAEDRWWPIGGSGLFLLAVAFAISGANPLALNGFLTAGTALVLCYSLISFFIAKVSVQAIWIVLNTVFILKPAHRTLELLGIL